MENLLHYDLETFNRDRALPCSVSFYPVSRILGKCDRDSTKEAIEICKNDRVVMEVEFCISQMFEYLKNYKGEPKRIKVKSMPMIGGFDLKLIGNNGSEFDSWIISYNLPTCCRLINPIETAKGLNTEKILIRFCDVKQKFKGKPQNTNLICTMNHLKGSLRSSRKTFGLRKKLFKSRLGS